MKEEVEADLDIKGMGIASLKEAMDSMAIDHNILLRSWEQRFGSAPKNCKKCGRKSISLNAVTCGYCNSKL